MRRFLLTLLLCCLLVCALYLGWAAVALPDRYGAGMGWRPILWNLALFSGVTAFWMTALGWPLHRLLVRLNRTGWRAYLATGFAAGLAVTLVFALLSVPFSYFYTVSMNRQMVVMSVIFGLFGGGCALIGWCIYHRPKRKTYTSPEEKDI
ncbi:MAG: hypothetical protein H2040_07035 [Euryhalocaulis sp.]|uniref:hypothetical protein n=1 Tax=Euryhalocaulis sp. TaxID=2744307 RepID=UPI00183595E6|nr:hypothetical protein [Euryhalocaulis sp.]MBA4801601.1 hypothetical protein [Euryhalocaulis sp.]